MSVKQLGLMCGVDIVSIEEMRRNLEVGGEEFLHRVYTLGERQHCQGRVHQLAARFAAKEAVLKALGTGMRGISASEVEVVSAPSGRPSLCLHNRALRRAKRLKLSHWGVSLSHSTEHAVALVVALAPLGVSDSTTKDDTVPITSDVLNSFLEEQTLKLLKAKEGNI